MSRLASVFHNLIVLIVLAGLTAVAQEVPGVLVREEVLACRERSLVAAAKRAEVVGAVVSRGGRPDLAGEALPRVKAPTLLIVGGNDVPVIAMNQEAMEQLRTEKSLVIVPGATHLFEEPGALERVARLARDWFVEYLLGDAVSLPGGEPARPA